MSIPILATKLYSPAHKTTFIQRSRLIEKLHEGLNHKLVLISAPAGFGKTTLASQWILESGYPHTWLSLDNSDSDPIRFLTYFITALEKVAPNVGVGLVERLQSPQLPSYESIITALINNVLTLVDEPFIFVLDDYHVLDSSTIDSILEFLIKHQPPHMHLVITTREDPNFSLARLRARHELTEIRIADLRFTTDEIVAFLNDSMGLNLSADDISTLEARTEGWIASLQMAALSMQGRDDIAGFLRSFTGSHRYILDYLVEEVLNQQADYIQEFLYQTSVLDRFTASLCNRITGRDNSQMILEDLERQNLLIIPLDDERQWYRYHHLFADVLSTYANQKMPNEITQCRQLASEWYEVQGAKSEAIYYAHAAKDTERVADLLELSWPAIFNGFKPSTWLEWVRTLPDDMVKVRPVLSAGYAWVLLDEQSTDEVESRLQDAERWIDLADSLDEDQALPVVANKVNYKSLASTVAGGYAYLYLVLGEVEKTVTYAIPALELLPEDDHYNRGIIAMFLGMAYWALGKLTLAYETFTNSVASLKRSNHLHYQIFGIVRLADIHLVQGQLHDALTMYQNALEISSPIDEAPIQPDPKHDRFIPGTVNLYAGLSELYLKRGDLKNAQYYADLGLSLKQQTIYSASNDRLAVVMTRIQIGHGNFDNAMTILHSVEQRTSLFIRHPIPIMHVYIQLLQGKLDSALRWAKEAGRSAHDPISFRHEFEYLTLVRILIALYREQKISTAINEAQLILDRFLDLAQADGRTDSVIEILTLQAIVALEQGHDALGLDKVRQAIQLAEPEGYVQVFIDAGEPMRQLLSMCLLQDADTQYITHLLQLFSPQDDTPTSNDPNQLLIEPLSDRELDVLERIANGYTNQAIADELFIALSTVKKHVNNIYGKLNVANRTQAIKRARDLNIL